jgi:hypothetical protein
MSRPALTLPSRTLKAVAQGLRQLVHTPSSWADLLESYGLGVREQVEPLLVELTRQGAHPGLIATLVEELAGQREQLELERQGCSFVWSGPKPLHNTVSDTWATITALIVEARTSVLIATHNIGLTKDRRDLFCSLSDRLRHGDLDQVVMIFHPKQIERNLGSKPMETITDWFDDCVWPWNPKPSAYIDRRLLDGSRWGCSQHAKVVLVDAGTPKGKALVTSANFSENAQRHNLEAGCLFTNAWQVERVADYFQLLIANEQLVPLIRESQS